MKIAFYAPMKAPTHTVPSGDRRIARLLMAALRQTGAEIFLASEFRSYCKSGDDAQQLELQQAGTREAERLIAGFLKMAPSARPAIWFSYHLYHKAPDWIGPRVAAALDIPYMVAEASHAPKQANGPWRRGYDAVVRDLGHADRVFNMTRHDAACLQQLNLRPRALVYLPPFLNSRIPAGNKALAQQIIAAAGGRKGRLNLLAVAMMRDGDKLQSYRQLAAALPGIGGEDWQLLLVGDGERRDEVQQLFSSFPEKVLFLGRLEPEVLEAIYQAADIYVWPAHGEAYGMAFLEAGLAGLPIVAGDSRGVPDVVCRDVSGLLTPSGDTAAFAAAIRRLMDDPDLGRRLGVAGRSFVMTQRSLEQATALLTRHIQEVVK